MNQLPSVMEHNFSRVPEVRIERSKFNRSHGIKTTFDAGWLVPVFCDEVLPGDTFNLRMSGFARLSTPLKPVMDNLHMDTFFFFVPNRLLWDDWEHFMGSKDNPDDATEYEVPYMDMPGAGVAVGSLSDYLGIPTGVTTGTLRVRSLFHRAYNLIWNQWFRDQNLQDSVVVDKDGGPDTYADYVLLKRGKRHDYFTSALPSPQKGDAVQLPLGTTAPVRVLDPWSAMPYQLVKNRSTSALLTGTLTSDGSGNLQSGGVDATLDPHGTWVADLEEATAATVNALREAMQLQVLLERDARGGTRYIEIIKSHFGVTCPDFRLQRPEYLGGGRSEVNIHPVPMTAMSSGGTAAGQQGNLAGFGTASFNGHGFNKSFVEHGVILGLCCVTADLTYSEGLERMFDRATKEEFYWPALAHLGEQAVKNKEIYANIADGTGAAQKDGTFGYQERHAEYRYKKSNLTGLMRPGVASSLGYYWTVSQLFGALPTLGSTFIQEDPPVDRVIAVPSEPHFIFDGYFNLTCARPMPVYGVPTVGDRL